MMIYDYMLLVIFTLLYFGLIGIAYTFGVLDKERKKEIISFEDYLEKHKDLCKYITECETFADKKCHNNDHIYCAIYLERERKRIDVNG